jgi:predicted DNA-binding protein (UPF0251 family)
MRSTKPAIERVLDKLIPIPFSGCWIFMGALNHFGYGIAGTGRRGDPVDRVHRITYKHFKGEIPIGMFVCHTCDIPSCCNPNHLFLGTSQDNVNDMVKKKRNSLPPRNPHVVGSVHPNAKLNEDQVLEIRDSYRKGMTQKILAQQYGVARQTISKIVNNKRFKHV